MTIAQGSICKRFVEVLKIMGNCCSALFGGPSLDENGNMVQIKNVALAIYFFSAWN